MKKDILDIQEVRNLIKVLENSYIETWRGLNGRAFQLLCREAANNLKDVLSMLDIVIKEIKQQVKE